MALSVCASASPSWEEGSLFYVAQRQAGLWWRLSFRSLRGAVGPQAPTRRARLHTTQIEPAGMFGNTLLGDCFVTACVPVARQDNFRYECDRAHRAFLLALRR
jgi:hypothetical protein